MGVFPVQKMNVNLKLRQCDIGERTVKKKQRKNEREREKSSILTIPLKKIQWRKMAMILKSLLKQRSQWGKVEL